MGRRAGPAAFLLDMIVNERITTYIHSLETDNSPFMEELRRFAKETDVPIIRREMESFLKVILEIKKPKSILEIGSGIAYSTLFMAGCTKSHITTIENYDKRLKLASENILKSGLSDRITLIEGDALCALPFLKCPYDFIFMDAAKGQYIAFLPEAIRLLKKGGVLLADNVLQDGDLIESRYITERRQRTIHERMREFLWEVKHSEFLDTTIITIGDGVSLSIRK